MLEFLRFTHSEPRLQTLEDFQQEAASKNCKFTVIDPSTVLNLQESQIALANNLKEFDALVICTPATFANDKFSNISKLEERKQLAEFRNSLIECELEIFADPFDPQFAIELACVARDIKPKEATTSIHLVIEEGQLADAFTPASLKVI